MPYLGVMPGREANPRRRRPRKHAKGAKYRLKVVPRFGRNARYARAKPSIGRPLSIPLKCGYSYDVTGTGAASLDFRQDVGLHRLPADWFTRYYPTFDFVRINKVRIEITCPYNIGQSGVGNQSLYRMWHKKALTTAETPPDSLTEWLNMQTARRTTFSGRTNSVNFYFTPAYESTVQPLNTAVTQLRLLYKQWQTIQDAPAKMTPHIGVLGQIHRMDGGAISNAHVFKVNVTLYCELKGVKEL